MATWPKFMGVAVAAALAIAFMTPSASADPLAVGDLIAFTFAPDHYVFSNGQIFMGGAFSLYQKVGDTYVFKFDTFCLEANEGVDLRALDDPNKEPYVIADISKEAILGGIGGTVPNPTFGTGDPISGETAWLYQQWRMGTLDVNGFTAPEVQYGIQLALWWFEAESAFKPTTGPGAYFTNLALNASAEDKLAALKVVSVINPVIQGATYPYQPTDWRQSVLTIELVPEPGTLVLFGIGLLSAGIVAVRRMRR